MVGAQLMEEMNRMLSNLEFMCVVGARTVEVEGEPQKQITCQVTLHPAEYPVVSAMCSALAHDNQQQRLGLGSSACSAGVEHGAVVNNSPSQSRACVLLVGFIQVVNQPGGAGCRLGCRGTSSRACCPS